MEASVTLPRFPFCPFAFALPFRARVGILDRAAMFREPFPSF
jgi:hypothetical protein